MSDFEVNVVVGTFNHEEYISKCLDSILNQSTTFNVSIILGEDCSDDRTREICVEYKKKYPNKIKLFLRSRKDVLYINEVPTGRFNFISNLQACKGKYIALLDGDDYWSDPFKLQKQIDILENKLNIIACHSWQKTAILENNEYVEKEAPKNGHGYYNLAEAGIKEIFLNKLRIKSRTLVFRNIFLEDKDLLPEWFRKVKYGDVPLTFILGQYGNFYFLDEEMAVYRQTNKGLSTQGKEKNDWHLNHYWAWIDIWCYADDMYNGKYHKETISTIRYFYNKILQSYKYSLKQRFRLMFRVIFSLKQPLFQRIKDAYFCLTVK